MSDRADDDDGDADDDDGDEDDDDYDDDASDDNHDDCCRISWSIDACSN